MRNTNKYKLGEHKFVACSSFQNNLLPITTSEVISVTEERTTRKVIIPWRSSQIETQICIITQLHL